MTSATPPLLTGLLRAAALGAASGFRSTAGATAVALTARPGDRGPAARAGRGRLLAAALTAAEVVADKLPFTPPRTQPAGLVPRLGTGAGSAAAAAQRDGGAAVPAAAVGAATAALTALLATRARAAAARRLGSDLPAALLEDVLVALLTWSATRRPAAPLPPGPVPVPVA